jgi:peroxiredoxin
MAKKKSRRKRQRPFPVIPMAGGLILIAFAFLFVASPGNRSSAGSLSSVVPAAVKYAAPQLSLQTVAGKAESLADYREDVVLVNNWATWCPPCKAEMPTLSAYYNEHREEGFTIIAISAGDPADAVAQFVQSYNLKFPVWLDPEQASLRAFGNGSLPNSYVIDRTGTVRYAWTGEINQVMLEKYVTPLLKEDR